MKKLCFYCLFFVFIFQICYAQIDNKVNEIVTETQKAFVPDKRVGIFDIKTEFSENKIIILGETDNKNALDRLIDRLNTELNISVENKVLLLPDTALKNNVFGIVSVSVANMRKENDHDAEMVSQTILGTIVKLLKKKSGFYLVQTPDGYLGWVESGSLVICDENKINEWNNSKRLFYIELFGIVYSKKVNNSDPVCDIVAGSEVKLLGKEGKWWKVMTPRGETGYLPISTAIEKEKWLKTRKLNFENIFKTAKRFLGFPYLWGGTSSKGLDCSGFVKTVFYLNGYLLPRDASQQANIGEEIIPEDNYKNVRPGDLLFFGSKKDGKLRVTHVAIYIKDYTYIHCASYVQISSLKKDAINFDPYHSDRLVKITRILK